MRTRYVRLVGTLPMMSLLYLSALTQEPTPNPPDKAIEIVTYEVKSNLMAQDKYGRFVPTLTPDDLLIVEEGTPRTLTSLRRVPANVLLLRNSHAENAGSELEKSAAKLVC